ncbi:MAG TPA: hypothetical protein VMJ30_04105 [Gemmatimonadales bacterium]|nr:hypothetical protein [Gemmatimonadales bacterium]
MPRRAIRCWLVLALALLPRVARAQESLTDKVTGLFTFGDCGAPLCLNVAGNSPHGSHFIGDAEAGGLTVVSFLTNSVGLNASSFPIGGTSGGTSFTLVGGVPVRTTSSLGPIFADRADNLGKGRFLMGADVNYIRYRSLRGVPMDNLNFNFTHQNVGDPAMGNPNFENDFITVQMSLNVDQLVAAAFVTYGLLNHLDISVAVPVVHTSLEGETEAQINPFGLPIVHYFAGDSINPILRASSTTFGSATGLGDVAARLKWGVVSSTRFSMAALADVRFPTGDEANLLGAGHYSVRGVLVASSHFGSFSPHLNVGYLYREGTGVNDQVITYGGFDQLVAPWATMAVDILANWELGTPFQVPPPVEYTQPYAHEIVRTNVPDSHDHRIDGSFGFKFRLSNAATALVNVLVPLRNGGVTPDVAYTTGLEFNF